MNSGHFTTYNPPLLSKKEEAYLIETINTHSKEKIPKIPEEVSPLLPSLNTIKAVVFDIYGTLLHSAAGEIHTHTSTNTQTFIVEELDIHISVSTLQALIHTYVTDTHTTLRNNSHISYPEIDAINMWTSIISTLQPQKQSISPFEAALCAVYYELLHNNAWIMPHTKEILTQLAQKSYLLGIVSNAQFYTILVLRALLGDDFLNTISFPIQVWSYLLQEAKPSKNLYKTMLNQCQPLNIQAHEILYIGNDKRNDIAPAHALGIKTLLFAGDSISYRPRLDMPEMTSIIPDGVITSLSQILSVVP